MYGIINLNTKAMIPQIIYFILLPISLMISAYRHGKPKEGHYNLWIDLVSYTISFIILYWGGFFEPMFGTN